MHRQSSSNPPLVFQLPIGPAANIHRRTEADEAYVIGKRGQYTPVGAYLAGDEIVKIALEHGAQMIHPGTFARSDRRV